MGGAYDYMLTPRALIKAPSKERALVCADFWDPCPALNGPIHWTEPGENSYALKGMNRTGTSGEFHHHAPPRLPTASRSAEG